MMKKEKILLVTIDEKKLRTWTPEDISCEMRELVISCGGEVVDEVVCRIDKISAAHFIGEGKIREIAGLCYGSEISTVVFSRDLKGSQQRNLEEMLQLKTIDRTQLILDIFVKRAVSMEGKMQVELAQLEYLLPRLVGKGIALSRLGGGIGTSGPGETKLEIDRRRIGQRIDNLQTALKEVAAGRALKRKKRQDEGVPVVSLVGYTNAGKSTLLNKLTDAHQPTHEGLFTTLDSLSRQYTLGNNQKIVLTDTVGFMHELPHHLIESFHATLEEVADADLLLHVLDISHVNHRKMYDAVLEVLGGLNALEKPVITVLNKIDKLEEKTWIHEILSDIKNPVMISALTGENLEVLIKKMEDMLSSLIVEVTVTIPINRMDLVSLAHEQGQVFFVKYYNDSIRLRASLPRKIAGLLEKAGRRRK